MRLPDFICIGAMRAGTTTLWNMLQQMPDVYLPDVKEIHFFDRDYDKGNRYYASFFEAAKNNQICGEITPGYLYLSECRDRIKMTTPDARLIVVLRDPVARAWSHYRFSVLWGPEQHNFKEALKLEAARLKDGEYKDRVYFSYAQRGVYIKQLKYFSEVFSSDQLLVVFLEDLINDKENVIRDIREHIGLSKSMERQILVSHQNELKEFPISLRVHQICKALKFENPGDSIKEKSIRKLSNLIYKLNLNNNSFKIPDEIAEQLKDYYEPYDRQLEEWLGRELPWRTSLRK